MKIIADLHIHSRFSRACSKDITIEKLERFAKIKGLNLLGTGDFTHPLWLKEIKNKLKEDETGVLKTKNGFGFILQTEVSSVYMQDGKQRKVHNIILAPSLDVVEQINEQLKRYGRLDYDGRPTFGFNCVELVEIMKNISNDIEIIPAHCWTPWYGIFGSHTGFDSVEDCFKERVKDIHALETGLSSDPKMNWRLSRLDRYNLVSFSDAHSYWPWRLGREAVVFDINDLEYEKIINAIRNGKGLIETIEVDPAYGKYHFDGHRNCNVCMDPKDSIKNRNRCPVCGRELTIGVLHRVEELADREDGYKPKNSKPFKSIIPLSEILSFSLGIKQIYSKKMWEKYNKLIKTFGSEFSVLLDAKYKDLKKVVHEKVANIIIMNRKGEIKIRPGFDGVYGVPLFLDERGENKRLVKGKQLGLSNFTSKFFTKKQTKLGDF